MVIAMLVLMGSLILTSCNASLTDVYTCTDEKSIIKSLIVSKSDQSGKVSIYYTTDSPYGDTKEVIFARDIATLEQDSNGKNYLESEWGRLSFDSRKKIIFYIPEGTQIDIGGICRVNMPRSTDTYLKTKISEYTEQLITQFEEQIEEQRIRAEEERKRLESQPIAIEPYECKFELGRYNTIKFIFKADLRNVSEKTFVGAEFDEEYVAGETWLGEPYTQERLASWVTMYFNKPYILRYSVWNWEYDGEAVFPSVSFDRPWKPQETKTFEVTMSEYDDDAVTSGFTAYEPKNCILNFNLTVEDPDGRKIPMEIRFDLMDIWKDFMNK